MEPSAALDAVFRPVEAPSTFEETVERLGRAVRLGVLPPGSRLPPERELADRLAIARTTLRQALTTLVQSGHLVAVRGRAGGTFVAEAPPLAAGEPLGAEARAALDRRVAVEAGAALLAVERATADDLARLDGLVAAMDVAGPFADYRRADVRFHLGLAEAAHAPALVDAMSEVQGAMSGLIARIAHPLPVLRRANEQHRRLVALLRRRDAARAVVAAREHCAGTEHILAGLL